MIQIRCNTGQEAKLSEMHPFQGDLKKRSAKDIDDLATSLNTEGILMPFALWQSPDADVGLKILDGHGRYAALCRLALSDVSILEQGFPIVIIEASTEDEARKALLQIVSTYGKIYKPGVIKFSETVIDYKAPIITKATTVPIHKVQAPDKAIIKLRVQKDKVKALIAILKDVDGVEIY